MGVRCVKSHQMTIRYNISDVKGLLWSYLSQRLERSNESFTKRLKGISYEKTPRTFLGQYIHYEEMDQIASHIKSLKVARASQWIEGYHWYALMVWLRFEEPRADLPMVRDKDVINAIKKLMQHFYKKTKDRFHAS